MRQRFCIKTDPSTCQFSNIKPEEWRYQQKCWIAQRIRFNRKMSYHLTGIPHMKDTKGERSQQNGQEHIGSCLSAAFTVDQDNDEDAEYDPTIDQDNE